MQLLFRLKMAFLWMRVAVPVSISWPPFLSIPFRMCRALGSLRAGASSRQGWLAPPSFFSWLRRRVGMCFCGKPNSRLKSSFSLFQPRSSPVRRHTGLYFSVVSWQHVSGVAKRHGRLPICNANEGFEYVLLQPCFYVDC